MLYTHQEEVSTNGAGYESGAEAAKAVDDANAAGHGSGGEAFEAIDEANAENNVSEDDSMQSANDEAEGAA